MDRHSILVAMALVAPIGAVAQVADHDTVAAERGLIEEVAGIKKKTDKFNLYLNMRGDFNAAWRGSTFDEGGFRMKQLRIEMTGQINDWLSYRYRQRLNKGDSQSGYRDNVLGSIDYAGIGIRLGKVSFFLGKQCAAYGGIDFNRNPIEVLENPALVEYMGNFMTGVKVAYDSHRRNSCSFRCSIHLLAHRNPCMGIMKSRRCPWYILLTGTAISIISIRPGGRHPS